jgi:hypothetical protein
VEPSNESLIPYAKDEVHIVEKYAAAVEKSIRLDQADWP